MTTEAKKREFMPDPPTMTAADLDIAAQGCEAANRWDDEENTDDTARVSDAGWVGARVGYALGLRAGLRRGILVMADQSPKNLLRLIRTLTDDAEADAILLEFVKREKGGAAE